MLILSFSFQNCEEQKNATTETDVKNGETQPCDMMDCSENGVENNEEVKNASQTSDEITLLRGE